MKGSANVIARLNELLAGELTAADQYLLHSRIFGDWGFHRLYSRFAHEHEEELGHADRLIRRILLLGGRPDMNRRDQVTVGADIVQMLKDNLDYEYKVAQALRAAIQLCEQERDFETRHILRELLADTEEDHMHWLEQQLALIDEMGLQNYLQSAIGELDDSTSG